MSTVTLSSKFQLVIPKEVRETMRLSSGVRFAVIPYDGQIRLIPLQPMKHLRGALKGMDTKVIREKDRL